MSGGAASKRKGSRIERELVHLHKLAGIDCKRVPLSGAVDGFKGDLRIVEDFTGEVKGRKTGRGFTVIERWLGDNDFLFLRQDRKKPLVVMPWGMYAWLMSKAGKDL